MGMFAEAIRRGLDAGKRAEEARCAVQRTLAMASRDVSSVVGVEIALRYVASDGWIRAETAGATTALAHIKISGIGFPLKLRWADRVERAKNSVEFETALVRLLESASTAEAILRLTRRESGG